MNSKILCVPQPLSKSTDGQAFPHTLSWEYFDSSLRVCECFRTNLFSPEPIGLLLKAHNAIQHGSSDNNNNNNNKKAYSNFPAYWASLTQINRIATYLAIIRAGRYHCGVLIRKFQPYSDLALRPLSSHSAMRMTQLSQLYFKVTSVSRGNCTVSASLKVIKK